MMLSCYTAMAGVTVKTVNADNTANNMMVTVNTVNYYTGRYN